MDREKHQTRQQDRDREREQRRDPNRDPDRNPGTGDPTRHETDGKDQLQGNWYELKMSVQQRWNKLTVSDLDRVSGNYEQLLARIQERYGITRNQAKRELDEFMRTHGNSEPASVRTGTVREGRPRQPDTKEDDDETIEPE